MMMAMKRLSFLLATSSSSPASSTFFGFHFQRSQMKNKVMSLKSSLLFFNSNDNPICFCLHTSCRSSSFRPNEDKKGCSSSFRNMNDALYAFNHMIHLHPRPSIVEFSKLLSAIVRMRHYETVISLSKQMELAGLSHDVYTFNILINCFCHLHRVDYGFSVMAKIIKLGFEPDIITVSTLINGLCIEGKVSQAMEFFNEMVARGYQPDVHVWTTIINGLCGEGLIDEAYKAFRQMEEEGCPPNGFSYNIIIRGFLQQKDASKALQLMREMKSRGFSLLDTGTRTMLVHDNLVLKRLLGFCEGHQGEKAKFH